MFQVKKGKCVPFSYTTLDVRNCEKVKIKLYGTDILISGSDREGSADTSGAMGISISLTDEQLKKLNKKIKKRLKWARKRPNE